MKKSEELGYGVFGFGRKHIVGVIGLGRSSGASLVSGVISDTIARRGLSKRVICLDNPANYMETDTLIMVIDPLPSKIKENIELYSKIKDMYDAERNNGSLRKQKVVFLLNKYNDGVDIKELESFLKINFEYIQDMIPPEKIYEAEYMEKSIVRTTIFEGIMLLADDLLLNNE